MANRYLCGALAAAALAVGVVTVPAYAQSRDGGLLPPEEHGVITAVGCYLRGGDEGKTLLLAHPKRGPVNSVTEAQCTASAGDTAIRLKDAEKQGMNDSMLGRWVEVNGRLEKEESTDPDDIREFYVRSFRILPVVTPQRAAAEPEPAPFVAPEPAPVTSIPEPVATSGVEPAPLPKTASPLPLTGLFGLFACAGSMAVRSFRSRRA